MKMKPIFAFQEAKLFDQGKHSTGVHLLQKPIKRVSVASKSNTKTLVFRISSKALNNIDNNQHI